MFSLNRKRVCNFDFYLVKRRFRGRGRLERNVDFVEEKSEFHSKRKNRPFVGEQRIRRVGHGQQCNAADKFKTRQHRGYGE